MNKSGEYNYMETGKTISSRLGIAVSTKTIENYVRQYIQFMSAKYEQRRGIVDGDAHVSVTKIRLNKGFISQIAVILNSLIVDLLHEAITSVVVNYNTRVTYNSVIDVLRINETLQRFAGLNRMDVMNMYVPFTEIGELLRTSLDEMSPGVFKNSLLFKVSLGKNVIERCGLPSFSGITDIVEAIRTKKMNKRTKSHKSAEDDNSSDPHGSLNISIAKGVNYALNYVAKKIIDNLMFKIFMVVNNQRTSIVFDPSVIMYVVHDIVTETGNRYINTLNFEIESRLSEWKTKTDVDI